MHLFQENPVTQDMKVKSIPACAIDVGYFNVKYTTGRRVDGGNSEIDCATFPALAPSVTANQLVHAEGAANATTCIVSVNSVDYVVGKGARSFMRGAEPRPVDPDYPVSGKYHALLLGAMNLIAESAGAGHELVIESLVLGLPLNTYAQYHKAVVDKAIGEHLIGRTGGAVKRRVTVEHAHVMVQPHGAMLNFGARRKVQGATLVVDPGGGTLDWFLLDEENEIAWSRSGAYSQAMIHVARAIAEEIKEGLHHQIGAMNAIDQALLSREATFMIGSRQYEIAKFRPLVDSVLEQSVKAMLDKTGPLDTVRRVLFTGGGAALFREYMERNFAEWKDAFEMDADPVFSNVRGFQMAAEALADERVRA